MEEDSGSKIGSPNNKISIRVTPNLVLSGDSL